MLGGVAVVTMDFCAPGFLAPSHTPSLLVSGSWRCAKGAESMALLGGPGPGL